MIRTGALLSGSHSRNYQNIVRQICGSSLIGYWPLDEQTGTVAYDRSGNARNGAHTGVTLLRPGVEMLTNGGFETAGAGGADVFGTWTETAGDGAIAATTTAGEFHTVTAAKLTGGATPVSTPSVSVIATVIPLSSYILSFWTRGDGTNAGRYTIKDATNGYVDITATASTGVTGTGYAYVSVPFTAPAGCVTVQVLLRCPNLNTGIAYFDDVSLTAVSPNGIRNACAPFYDGTNDYTNIYSAGLASAFNGAEGTLAIWARVSGVGVWTDGSWDRAVLIGADTNNRVYIEKNSTNDRWGFGYIAGGTNSAGLIAAGSTTSWVHLALTWSKSGDVLRRYINSALQASSPTGLGVWSGAPAAASTVIGAGDSTTPATPWSGLLNHAVLCNRALSAPEIARLYRAGLPLVA